MLNMNEVDKYVLNTGEITYLTSSMIQFMEITYTQTDMTYSRIPIHVKNQYINLFKKLFNQEAITDGDLPENFEWKNLFKRAIDGEDMLRNNVLAPLEEGNLSTNVLKQIFGNDIQREWHAW